MTDNNILALSSDGQEYDRAFLNTQHGLQEIDQFY